MKCFNDLSLESSFYNLVNESCDPLFGAILDDDFLLSLMIKTFEVNKCLYDSYSFINTERGDRILKPDKSTSYKTAVHYGLFALALIRAYVKTKELFILNTLIKLNDTLLSNCKLEFSTHYNAKVHQELLALSVSAESEFVKEILQKCSLELSSVEEKLQNFSSHLESKDSQAVFVPKESFERIECALIYAISARSSMYLNAMLSAGKAPSKILVLIAPNTNEESLAMHLEFLGKNKLDVERIQCAHINDAQCFEKIKNLKEKVVLYSGYGGQILEPKYFALDKKFLHIHAGSLPQFRGSTTCYYELLECGCVSATCIFLSAELDGGDCIAHFTCDRAQIKALGTLDIDNTLEPFVRAKTLLKALRILEDKNFTPQKQDSTKGRTFYKIHPILKHIAILYCLN